MDKHKTNIDSRRQREKKVKVNEHNNDEKMKKN